MTMKIAGVIGVTSALGVFLIAPGCSSSNRSHPPPPPEPMEAGELGGSSSGTGSSTGGASGSGGQGVGTETQILCLGSFYCNPGTVCCGNMTTRSSTCSTGPSCPSGQLQLCKSDCDCSGASCLPVMLMGITIGTCGLAGMLGSSTGSGGGGSSSSGSGSSGACGSDAGISQDAGDGATSPGPDASTE
jgi:hypothetical protein